MYPQDSLGGPGVGSRVAVDGEALASGGSLVTSAPAKPRSSAGLSIRPSQEHRTRRKLPPTGGSGSACPGCVQLGSIKGGKH